MIFNMSGGGASLNFAVYGGTNAPVSPKENDIWINTDTEITKWAFSAEAPENPEEGMVWIFTGKASGGAFNLLNDNCVMVYPVSAMQYIDGAWTAKEAKSYINGEWKDWFTYVFRNGAFIDTSFGASTGTNCKVELRDGQIYIYGEGQSNTILYTTAQFDCTKFSKLVVVISKTINSNVGAVGNLHIGVSDTKADKNFVASSVVQPINLATETEYTVDISAVSGSYYIKIADIRSVYFADQIYIKEIRLA